MKQNITPDRISNLAHNEIFVFGSNLEGKHYGGAARFAVMKFGAEMGNPIGLQGQSYAIPTLSAPGGARNCDKLPPQEIGKYVQEFANFASQNPNMFFYVTPIGCGIAGFTEQEIAPLFKCCVGMQNVALPQSFVDILGINESKSRIKYVLTETELHNIIRNVTRRVLTEMRLG